VVNNEIKYKARVIKEFGKLPMIRCLPSQLNQVFMNLLVNAAHAIETQGEITLRTGVEGNTTDGNVWVEIADTGVGIPEPILTRIFDPFFTTKPVGKGTGLGLSLSYGIVQKHGGHIDVGSEVGKGSVFRVTLPIHPDNSEANNHD
jgi:signal transduction histidine kinase